MTTYTTIPDADIDQDSPVTQPLMTALRDNPIAIAEADSSVAAGLLPSVKLGTLTTTSGATHSLTSLDLSPYKFIMAVFNGVSSGVSFTNTINFQGVAVAQTTSSSDTRTGMVIVDVERGQGFYVISNGYQGIDTSITSATTTITVSITGTGAVFDAGTVEIYGVK